LSFPFDVTKLEYLVLRNGTFPSLLLNLNI
jgi:hypothetical protein